jgi:hypothetical protein
MTLAELRAKWERRASEWAMLGVSVDGAMLAVQVIAELDTVAAGTEETVTLAEAHRLGGYSADRLQHLVASGQIENVGRKHRPRIRRRDVPVKPGYMLTDAANGAQFSERRRIAASVLGDHS